MARDPSWHLWRSFLAVARHGSLSAAARALGLTQPTLGRHVEALEEDLGHPLFTRAPDGLIPTEAATALIPLAEEMEAAALSLARAAGAAEAGGLLAGTVRITASEVMGAEILPPILARLQERHPRLVIELALNNRTENLLRRDADIAVRMRPPEQTAILARRLGRLRLGLHAHRDYIARAGMPAGFEDLARFHVIGFDRDTLSVDAVTGGRMRVDRSLFSFRSDSDLAQLAALRAGLGIGAIQLGLAAREPDLVPVLPGEVEFTLDLWLAMHEDQRANPAIRAAWDVLAEGLAAWVALSPAPGRDPR